MLSRAGAAPFPPPHLPMPARLPTCLQLWGGYYLRWWMTKQLLTACGEGVFGLHPAFLVAYYRMLGARIGRRVLIDGKAELDAYDLVELGERGWGLGRLLSAWYQAPCMRCI